MFNPLTKNDRDSLRKLLEENKGRYAMHEEICGILTALDRLQEDLLKETEDKLLLEAVLKEQAEGLDELRARIKELRENEERYTTLIRAQAGKLAHMEDHLAAEEAETVSEPTPEERATKLAQEHCLTSGHAFGRAKDEIRAAVAAERESIARWLEGEGQPGYAHKVRKLYD
jgi:hypothetical protein